MHYQLLIALSTSQTDHKVEDCSKWNLLELFRKQIWFSKIYILGLTKCVFQEKNVLDFKNKCLVNLIASVLTAPSTTPTRSLVCEWNMTAADQVALWSWVLKKSMAGRVAWNSLLNIKKYPENIYLFFLRTYI